MRGDIDVSNVRVGRGKRGGDGRWGDLNKQKLQSTVVGGKEGLLYKSQIVSLGRASGEKAEQDANVAGRQVGSKLVACLPACMYSTYTCRSKYRYDLTLT